MVELLQELHERCVLIGCCDRVLMLLMSTVLTAEEVGPTSYVKHPLIV
jgi:hypothetical protein